MDYYYEDSFKQFLWKEHHRLLVCKRVFADLPNSNLYTGKLCYLALLTTGISEHSMQILTILDQHTNDTTHQSYNRIQDLKGLTICCFQGGKIGEGKRKRKPSGSTELTLINKAVLIHFHSPALHKKTFPVLFHLREGKQSR